MSRRKAREAALQMLFQIDIGKNEWQAAEYTLEESQLQEVNAEFSRQVVKGAIENLADIDKLINHYAQDWSVDRLVNVDKTILRLAIYELLHMDTPYRIIINEAVELAKIFGGDDSGAFVNGLLDALCNNETVLKENSERYNEFKGFAEAPGK